MIVGSYENNTKEKKRVLSQRENLDGGVVLLPFSLPNYINMTIWMVRWS